MGVGPVPGAATRRRNRRDQGALCIRFAFSFYPPPSLAEWGSGPCVTVGGATERSRRLGEAPQFVNIGCSRS